jgi:hypothetical protein
MENGGRRHLFRKRVQAADSAFSSKVATHGLEQDNLELKDLEIMFCISLRGKLNKLGK